MHRLRTHRLGRTVVWCAIGCAGVGLLTALAFRLHLGFVTASFCFLLLVVLQALSGNAASAVLVACLSVAGLDYYFVDPLFSFQAESPLDTLGLVSFLITGIVIARLVTKVRAKTEESRLEHQKLQQLYALAQSLLTVEPGAQTEFLAPFVGVFGITTACLFDALSADIHLAGSGRRDLEEKTGAAFIHCRDYADAQNGIYVRCIRVGEKVIGAIGFEGLEDAALTSDPMVALAAAHLERRHSFLKASRAAATVQTESYRSALLDALAHEFKTPLSTILAAAGSLREAGSLEPHQRDMAETVESEAARLGRLTSRLIRTARLEREEVKPWIEPIDLSSVITDMVDQYSKVSGDKRIAVTKECGSAAALADPELLRLAISQLLDNACKYSEAGSVIALRISRQRDHIVIQVVSSGNPIPSGERTRIFDRFYRGSDGRRIGPGSGLGLYVARKIALALGGSLDLEADPDMVDGSAFRLTLPVPESERNDLATAV